MADRSGAARSSSRSADPGRAAGSASQGSGGQSVIKFDPEKILEVSQNLENLNRRFGECTSAIKSRADSLKGVWQSDTATLYDERMKELDTKSNEMASDLKALSQDLASASGIYKKGEADAKAEAETLPTDGVFLV